MLTKVLALELAEHGITVNAVAPGEIATEMTGQDEEDAYRTSRPGNPLGRPGHVNEVASVIGFLASPRAAYVTGSSYAVDGGLVTEPGPMASLASTSRSSSGSPRSSPSPSRASPRALRGRRPPSRC